MPSRRSSRREDYSRLFDSTVCAFCGINDDDEFLYGKLFVSDTLTVHYNCMFFASGLSQDGKETQGIAGFLLPHIEAELRRGKKLFCSYCKKRGATIGCCELKCKKSFHLNCGIKYGSLHQFFGSFCSFCKTHRPEQKNVQVTDDLYCYICCEGISSKDLESCLYSPCCKKNWSHRLCLQKYALSAGLYFFKCPFCNNNKEFVKEMKTFGINVPDKDAAWELEDNAYQELLFKPQCDATICACSKGREYCGPSRSGWSLLSCSYCGSHARHKHCEKLKWTVKRWICQECKTLENEMRKSKLSTNMRKESIANKNDDLRSETITSSSTLCTLSMPPSKNDDLENETVTSSSALCTFSTPSSVNDDLGTETVSSSSGLCTPSSPPAKNDDLGCETITSSSASSTFPSPSIDDDLGTEAITSSSALLTLCTPDSENDNLVNNTTSSALSNLCSSFNKDLDRIKKGKMKYVTVDSVDVAESSSLYFQKSDAFKSISDAKESDSLMSDNQMIEMDVSEAFVPSENKAKNFFSPKPITEQTGTFKLQSQTKMKNLKNAAHSSAKKRPYEVLKPRTVRKVSKKPKKAVTCCSDPNHICIKKYFGQKCGKYRL